MNGVADGAGEPDSSPELDLSALAWRGLPSDDRPLRLVVLGDSTAFTDDRGPQLPDEPVLYPNVVARRLEAALDRAVRPVVVAEPGMTVRVAHRAATKDRHVMFDVLLDADMVVVGIGGFDHAPMGVPAAVEAVVPYLRPTRLRRAVRRGLRAAYPLLARATGSRLHRIATAEFVRLFDRLLVQVRGLSKGAPAVVLGPTSHDHAPYYGGRAPRFREAEAAQLAVAERHGIATVSAWDLAEPHGRRFNVDRIHWPAEVHEAVGEAVADLLLPQLRGDVAPPGIPSADEA